tara:strand:- start:47776 stop:49236 length:1461 start_codon:yes stop_codon:yes gene_type:complete
MSDTSLYFRLPPYEHQESVWQDSRDLDGYALWWEMGVGKTCEIIGTTSYLFLEGKIDTLIVVAPNGVHANWTIDEVPMHLPDAIMAKTKMLTWFSSTSTRKSVQAEFAELVGHDGLVVFVMSYDAVMTDRGAKALKKLLDKRECLYVLDESGRIKTPGSKRTKRILASARYAKYKRVLTGTPVDNSPFDVYTQIKFCRPDALAKFGITNFATFKARYGIWEKRVNRGTGRSWDELVRYIKLDELHGIVDSVGSRLLKRDVLDLPDKIYEKRHFDLDPAQKKAYKELDKKFITWFEGQSSVTADLVLTRMLRMSQLCCGFIKDDDDQVRAVGKNVRLKALQDVLEDTNGHVIIWCRWSWEVDEIRKVLGEEDAVYYDGRTSDQGRLDAKARFQRDGTAKYFVAKASAAGEGLTLHRAKTVIYMSLTYSLRERLQSEDRAHRAGMNDEPVLYIDILARNTYDEKLLQILRGKRNVASLVTGDFLTDWA